MDAAAKALKLKIRSKKNRVVVVGLGYVGLPLALEFAKKGFHCTGIEIDKDRISRLRKKQSYITDISDKELRKVIRTGRFSATSDFGVLKEADAVIICVPTPLKKKYSPNISYIVEAVKSIRHNMKKGTLIILESTTYPGTTEEVILPLLEQDDFKHDRDFYLAFSPERIDPGNASYPVHKIPKVVGGISPQATELAKALYENTIDKVVPVSSARVAEVVKLLENTFRLINIGLIDEIAMMAHKMKVDIWEVIEAAKTKPFGFMPFYPGVGCGGHCIPKDPLYLYWKAKHHGFVSRFIRLAADVTNYMPEYVAERIISLVKEKNKIIRRPKILIIGVTYKKDVKDLRKSPSLELIEILQRLGTEVAYYDPLIPYLKFNQINLRSIEFKQQILSRFDCVVIATDHSALDYNFLARHARLIFDTRNVYKGKKDKKIYKL